MLADLRKIHSQVRVIVQLQSVEQLNNHAPQDPVSNLLLKQYQEVSYIL